MSGTPALIADRWTRPVRMLWTYRSFIWSQAVHDLRYRYAGSAIGAVWNIVIPLAQILIYTVVFSQIMKNRLPGSETMNGYAIYLCSGLLPWMSFSECVSRGTNAFIENATYLKKLPIPEQVFIAQNAVAATLGLCVSMTLLFVITLLLGGGASWSWLGVPLVVVLLQGMGFGLGMAFGSVNVFIRDVGQVIGILLQMWMWVTPIVYLKEILPLRLRGLEFYNPAFPYIESLQGMFVRGQWPAAALWELMCFWSLSVPILGYMILRKLRPEIRDVI